jgi:MoaA/NifB/PqqE/SkfB family radical SAM enzyme
VSVGDEKVKHLTIDACSSCQLKCERCPVTQMGYQNTIGNGYLTFDKFTDIVLADKQIRSVDFDNFGELFLNPDLPRIMKFARGANIRLQCGSGVNGNFISDEALWGLVENKFAYLSFSIDGATQETYSTYRKRGMLDHVLSNISKINDLKRAHNTIFPKLQWQFIVFGHNEHEIPDARAKAVSLGMDFYPKMNWDSSYSPIKDPEYVKKQTGWDVTNREEYEKKYGVSYMRSTCYSLWNSPRLSWDGTMTGCCWNIWDRFNEDSMFFAKSALFGNLPALHHVPCSQCKELYHEMEKHDAFITSAELAKAKLRFQLGEALRYYYWRNRK